MRKKVENRGQLRSRIQNFTSLEVHSKKPFRKGIQPSYDKLSCQRTANCSRYIRDWTKRVKWSVTADWILIWRCSLPNNKNYHVEGNHVSGKNQTLASLPTRFWIVAGREELRGWETECYKCRRRQWQGRKLDYGWFLHDGFNHAMDLSVHNPELNDFRITLFWSVFWWTGDNVWKVRKHIARFDVSVKVKNSMKFCYTTISNTDCTFKGGNVTTRRNDSEFLGKKMQ